MTTLIGVVFYFENVSKIFDLPVYFLARSILFSRGFHRLKINSNPSYVLEVKKFFFILLFGMNL